MSDNLILTDPVVAEIHATRAAMLEAADGDIGLLMQQVAERQRKSKHRIATAQNKTLNLTANCLVEFGNLHCAAG